VPLAGASGPSPSPRDEDRREEELEDELDRESERGDALESEIEAELMRQEELLRQIEAEEAACAHYKKVIKATDGEDYVTQDLCIRLLADEEEHLVLFRGFLKEYAP